MTSPRTLPLDQVTPGMTLGADIQDAHGTTLLAAGTELGESHLAALRRRDVRQVVVSARETLNAAEREARREEVRARLSHLFRHSGHGEADRQLYQAILAHRLEQLE